MFTLGKLTVTGLSAPKQTSEEPSFINEILRSLSTELDCTQDVFLALDPSKRDCQLARKQGCAVRVAILMEPPVVAPLNGNPNNFKSFDLVFELGRMPESVPKPHISLPWPQDLTVSEGFHNTIRKKNYVIVCANKFSFVPGELYTLRRKLILHLGDNIALYGRGWQDSRLKIITRAVKAAIFAVINRKFSHSSKASLILSTPNNFFGQPKEKLITLQNYERTLVVENWNQYYTEKLFDAFRAGCTPIFVGPPLAKIGIPEGFAIQGGSNYEELVQVLSSSQHKLEVGKLEELKAWLVSNDNPHHYKSVAKCVLEIVRNSCRETHESRRGPMQKP